MEQRVVKDILYASVHGSSMVVDFGKAFVFKEREALQGQKVTSKIVAIGKRMVIDLNEYCMSLHKSKTIACIHARGPNLWIRQVKVKQPQFYTKQAKSEIQQVLYTYEDESMCVEGVECVSISLQLYKRGERLEIQACLA